MRINARHSRLRSAFSLVELMIGVAIFGVIIGGIYSSLVVQYATVRLNTQELRATQILTDKMEMLRLCSWTQITNGSFVPATFVGSFNSNTNSSDYGLDYAGTITIAVPPMSEAYAANLRLVTVQLAWTNSGVPRLRSASTLVSQYGLQNSIY